MNSKITIAALSILVALTSLQAHTSDQNIKYKTSYSTSEGKTSYQSYVFPVDLKAAVTDASAIQTEKLSNPNKPSRTDMYFILKDSLNKTLSDETLSEINRNPDDIAMHPQGDGRKVTIILKPDERNTYNRLKDFDFLLKQKLGSAYLEDDKTLLDAKVQAIRILDPRSA